MENNELLVTGSRGDIGKKLILFLEKRKYNYFGLTRNRNLTDRELTGDLLDYTSLLNATKNIHTVVHGEMNR